MTGIQRRLLICLTAASGDIVNLNVALAASGLAIDAAFLEAAASAGSLSACCHLRQRHCPWGAALSRAARGGHWHVCEWMLDNGCAVDEESVVSAALGGHVDLMSRLRQRYPAPLRAAFNMQRLIRAAAFGCDLATLQSLYQEWLRGLPRSAPDHQPLLPPPPPPPLIAPRNGNPSAKAAAASSPTPDWQAKLEWLEAPGRCQPAHDICLHVVIAAAAAVAAALPYDATARLAWLQQRDDAEYEPTLLAVTESAKNGHDLSLLSYLLDEVEKGGAARPRRTLHGPAVAAASGGNLAALQLLHARGFVDSAVARSALRNALPKGHLHVVEWLVDHVGIDLQAFEHGGPWQAGVVLLDLAARSGNLRLLAWLEARGCDGGAGAVAGQSVAASGCEAAVEWLVERGHVKLTDSSPYTKAAVNGDLAMLSCLRRLGFATDTSGSAFWMCLEGAGSLPVLQWLVGEGQEEEEEGEGEGQGGLGRLVDWEWAVELADRRTTEDRDAVRAWVRRQRQQRQRQHQQQQR